MKKKIIAIVAAIAVIVCIGAIALRFTLFSGGDSNSNDVYVDSVADLVGSSSGISSDGRYAGVVESEKTLDVKKDSERTVKECYVTEGQEVQVGTPLFAYDTDETSMNLERANLELERINNNIATLNSQIAQLEKEKQGVSADNQLDYTTQILELQSNLKQSEYEVQTKQIEIQKLQSALDNSVVTSTMAGVVKNISDSTTDDYSTTEPAYITILGSNDYRIKATINEQNIWSIEVGKSVIVHSRVDDTIWKGTIGSIDTENAETNTSNMYGSSDSMTQSSKYPFYISLESNEGLILGQHVYVELDYGQLENAAKEGLWFYSMYIVNDEGGSYVWAVDGNNKIEKRAITLGEYDEESDTYEILDGLSEEDYVAWPDDTVKEGAKAVKYSDSYDDVEAN